VDIDIVDGYLAEAESARRERRPLPSWRDAVDLVDLVDRVEGTGRSEFALFCD
jgi:hypothetical protein